MVDFLLVQPLYKESFGWTKRKSIHKNDLKNPLLFSLLSVFGIASQPIRHFQGCMKWTRTHWLKWTDKHFFLQSTASPCGIPSSHLSFHSSNHKKERNSSAGAYSFGTLSLLCVIRDCTIIHIYTRYTCTFHSLRDNYLEHYSHKETPKRESDWREKTKENSGSCPFYNFIERCNAMKYNNTAPLFTDKEIPCRFVLVMG